MAYCELGAANGLFMVQLGPKVMPGGRILATGLGNELAVMTAHAAEVGLAIEAIEGTDAACGLPAASCDVIFTRSRLPPDVRSLACR